MVHFFLKPSFPLPTGWLKKKRKERKENLLKNMEYTAARALSGSLNGEANLITVGLSGGVSYALGMGIFRRQRSRLQRAGTHCAPGLLRLGSARLVRPHTINTVFLSPPPPPPPSTSAQGQMVAVARCRCVSGWMCVFSCLGWDRRRGKEERGVPAVPPFPFQPKNQSAEEIYTGKKEKGKTSMVGAQSFSCRMGTQQSNYRAITIP